MRTVTWGDGGNQVKLLYALCDMFFNATQKNVTTVRNAHLNLFLGRQGIVGHQTKANKKKMIPPLVSLERGREDKILLCLIWKLLITQLQPQETFL